VVQAFAGIILSLLILLHKFNNYLSLPQFYLCFYRFSSHVSGDDNSYEILLKSLVGNK